MVIMSWNSTFMVPRLCAGAISARYSGTTCAPRPRPSARSSPAWQPHAAHAPVHIHRGACQGACQSA